MAVHIWAKLSPYMFCHGFRIGGNFLLDENMVIISNRIFNVDTTWYILNTLLIVLFFTK